MHETRYSRNVDICLEHVSHLALKTLQSADPNEKSVCYHRGRSLPLEGV